MLKAIPGVSRSGQDVSIHIGLIVIAVGGVTVADSYNAEPTPLNRLHASKQRCGLRDIFNQPSIAFMALLGAPCQSVQCRRSEKGNREVR